MRTAFAQEWARHFRIAVRNANQRAFERAAFLSPERVYVVLAEELSSRGIEPEPDAVFDGAILISRGGRPAILHDAARDSCAPDSLSAM